MEAPARGSVADQPWFGGSQHSARRDALSCRGSRRAWKVSLYVAAWCMPLLQVAVLEGDMDRSWYLICHPSHIQLRHQGRLARRHLASATAQAAAPAQDSTPQGPAARTLTIKPAATAVNATAVVPSTINDPASDRAVDPVAAANASVAGQGSAPALAPAAGAPTSTDPGQPLPSTTNDPNAASAVHPQPASGRCAAPFPSHSGHDLVSAVLFLVQRLRLAWCAFSCLSRCV